MPNIRPIKELRNTAEISDLCHSISEPVFITKNGYSDMVIMSSEVYDGIMTSAEILARLSSSVQDISDGKGVDGTEVLKRLREKYRYEV
ncbi:MAG: type II toxin-antitoxin system Phd/YefM family antitoxin [Ruminococcus sp.]|nr:type II toxin-antitoxin system Phd/YefM family antitoxin [Ruminococcus sp.]